MNDPLVYVLILNWNGWADTIECLESVFRNDYSNYRVILCDNGSRDYSLAHVKAWAEGRQDAQATSVALRHLSQPQVPKPISYVEYDPVKAEAGGQSDVPPAPLVLVQNGSNLGFAGGNNVGLRYALARDDFEYVWILNNDTVIKSNALAKMVKRLRAAPKGGICGSTLLYYDAPETIQELGGCIYYKWLGMARRIGRFQSADKPVDATEVETRMNYVSGASALVSKTFLHEIGLMSEDYFLFYEEIDWATRARGRYAMVFAPESKIYHKKGMATGSGEAAADRSPAAEYYLLRSRLLFTKKFYPFAVPVVYLTLLMTAVGRFAQGKTKHGKMIFEILLNRGNGKTLQHVSAARRPNN